MSKVDEIINGIIDREGGYVNNPKDRGGATKYGITEVVARQNGYQGHMMDFPIDLARSIYEKTYYVRPGFDDVATISPKLAEALMDAGVLCGPAKPSTWLQRLLNVLNREQRLYKDIEADGAIGHNTLAALSALIAKHGVKGEDALINGLKGLLTNHFITIAEGRPANEEFILGWLLNRVNI